MAPAEKSQAADSAQARKLLHDLRARCHGLQLNVDAVELLARRQPGDTSAGILKHLSLMRNDLKQLQATIETLAALLGYPSSK